MVMYKTNKKDQKKRRIICRERSCRSITAICFFYKNSVQQKKAYIIKKNVVYTV